MSSDSDIWDEVSTLFDLALDLPPEDRVAWLRKSCENSRVMRRVLRMLEAEGPGVKFLDGPLESIAPDLVIDSVASTAPTRVGNYLLVEEIGRGGMGAVYRGVRDDGQFDHQAAIKLMKTGIVSDHLRARFLAERQILASLNHPNIARLLDGGVTEDGESYFVMEFVDGVPLNRFCEQHECSIEERLQLMIKVCDAVSHAHQKLVVHRDLKPSNIFVTKNERVKLLDFGIAKLVSPEAAGTVDPQTRTGLHLLTPEYATPEQVTGQPVTTASDVYQIGLLLFELLTGSRPFRFKTGSLAELAHVVCQEEPKRPSTMTVGGDGQRLRSIRDEHWRSAIKGDLDAIVLKALRKNPADRYASIDKLADDLRAHLQGRPVSASEGKAAYRARKFVARHKWRLTAAAAFVLVLCGYAVTVTVEQSRTAAERDRAAHYASFLTSLLSSPDPFGVQAEVDQRDITVQGFLDRSAEEIRQELGSDPKLQIDLLRTVGEVYTNLGIYDKARPVLQEALDLAIANNGLENPGVAELMGLLAQASEDPVVADSIYRRQLELARRIEVRPGPLTAKSLVAYGGRLYDLGRWVEADSILRLATSLNIGGVDPTQTALALYYRGQTNRVLDRLNRADSLLSVALELTSQTFGANHPYTAMIKTELAAVTEFKGDAEDVERLRREALATFEERLGVDHPTTIRALNDLAILLSKSGKPDEAESIMRKIYDLQANRLGTAHHETVNALQNLATFLLKQGKLEEAEPLFHDVSRQYAASLPPDHYLHAFPLLSLTEIHLLREQYDKARETAAQAVSHLRVAFPAGHPLIAVAQSREGAALTGLNRYAEAEASLLAAMAGLESSEGFKYYVDVTEERLDRLYEA